MQQRPTLAKVYGRAVLTALTHVPRVEAVFGSSVLPPIRLGCPMSIKLSRCKGCGTCFQPWDLRCPKCGRWIPLIPAMAILATAFAVYEIGLWLGIW